MLAGVAGTSLDSGPELDALITLSPERREAVVQQAERGERVSARPPENRARAILMRQEAPLDAVRIDALFRKLKKHFEGIPLSKSNPCSASTTKP